MKFCKDCKYCVPSSLSIEIDKFAGCTHPKNCKVNINKITGKVITEFKYEFCATVRYFNPIFAYIVADCGQSARWFEAREND